MYLLLDGPSAQGSITANTTTAQEFKVGASALDERKVIEIQPIDGNIYIYFGDGSTPSAATVVNNGFLLRKERTRILEAGPAQQVFAVAVTGTVDVRFAERA